MARRIPRLKPKGPSLRARERANPNASFKRLGGKPKRQVPGLTRPKAPNGRAGLPTPPAAVQPGRIHGRSLPALPTTVTRPSRLRPQGPGAPTATTGMVPGSIKPVTSGTPTSAPKPPTGRGRLTAPGQLKKLAGAQSARQFAPGQMRKGTQSIPDPAKRTRGAQGAKLPRPGKRG